MASGSEGDLLKAAERVWGMLDKMAANDPEEYKKFMKQQLEEGSEVLAVPEPSFCLRCSLDRSTKYRYLFVNVCGWTRVPRPKTDKDPIPVKGGTVRHVLVGPSRRKTEDLVYDVAFHPSVLEECLKDGQMTEMLVGLCIDYVQNEVDVAKIEDKKNCKRVGIKHKGPVEDIRSSIDEDWRHCLAADITLGLEPQTLLSKIKEMKTNRDDAADCLAKLSTSNKESHNGRSSHAIPGGVDFSGPNEDRDEEILDLLTTPASKPPGQALIEELESTTLATSGASTSEGSSVVSSPEHTLAITREETQDGWRKLLHLVVKLPHVNSVQEVDLEVSENDLELNVPDKYHLLLTLPMEVDDDQTQAKFNAQLSELVIIIPCQQNTS